MAARKGKKSNQLSFDFAKGSGKKNAKAKKKVKAKKKGKAKKKSKAAGKLKTRKKTKRKATAKKSKAVGKSRRKAAVKKVKRTVKRSGRRTRRAKAGTAESMAAQQRDISISEFFAKNRHLLGFDNPRKALLTAVKEAVDNSLDA